MVVTGWLARAGLWASNQGFVAECTVRVLSSTTQPNSDHSWIFFLKMQLTDYIDWKNNTFVALHDLILSNFVLCFQFRHAKHFGVKEWLWNGEMWKGTLIFNYLPCFQHQIKILLQIIFLSNAKSFLVEQLPVSNCYYYRVKNKCSDRSLDMLLNFDQQDLFLIINIYNQISAHLKMLIE